MHLDRGRKKFLGVCAGLAGYLDVEPWVVRAVFLGGVLFGGWFLIPLYFIIWFLLDDDSSTARSTVTDNLVVKHFRTVDYKKRVYRNTREGKWLGVCAGIADYLEVSAFAVRIVFVLLFFTTAGFPLIFYLAAWLVLDKKPVLALPPVGSSRFSAHSQAQAGDQASGDKSDAARERQQAEQEQFQETLREELHSGRREFKYCARKFIALQSRLARMEAYVTSKRFRLHREFRDLS